ncbi:MAG: beta-N-acetylhexosaminidase, partial [Bacteroides sp.]
MAEYFSAKINHSTGYNLAVKKSANKNCIKFTIDSSLKLKDEGYKLDVTPTNVSVVAKTAQGVFYGMQTVMQLLPAEIESSKKINDITWKMPCVSIQDEPNYPYRGMMLDVCRHFYDVEFVKKQLDVMA